MAWLNDASPPAAESSAESPQTRESPGICSAPQGIPYFGPDVVAGGGRFQSAAAIVTVIQVQLEGSLFRVAQLLLEEQLDQPLIACDSALVHGSTSREPIHASRSFLTCGRLDFLLVLGHFLQDPPHDAAAGGVDRARFFRQLEGHGLDFPSLDGGQPERVPRGLLEFLANLPHGPAKDFTPVLELQQLGIRTGVRLLLIEHGKEGRDRPSRDPAFRESAH